MPLKIFQYSLATRNGPFLPLLDTCSWSTAWHWKRSADICALLTVSLGCVRSTQENLTSTFKPYSLFFWLTKLFTLRTYGHTIPLKQLLQCSPHFDHQITLQSQLLYLRAARPRLEGIWLSGSQTLFILGKNHPNGAAAYGLLWSIATNGKAMMRLCFVLCISYKLLAPSLHYSLLWKLSGFDLFTGMSDITMIFGPKHVIKHASTCNIW